MVLSRQGLWGGGWVLAREGALLGKTFEVRASFSTNSASGSLPSFHHSSCHAFIMVNCPLVVSQTKLTDSPAFASVLHTGTKACATTIQQVFIF